MKQKSVELVFIIDKSGSMSGLENDTIDGFNSMIEKRKSEGETSESLPYSSIRFSPPSMTESP